MLEFTGLGSAVGIDPFLDAEHKAQAHDRDDLAGRKAHDRDDLFAELADFVAEKSPNVLDFESYRALTSDQHFSIRPASLAYRRTPGKEFRFAGSPAPMTSKNWTRSSMLFYDSGDRPYPR